MPRLRNLAHDLAAILSVLLAAQAPITAYLANFDAPERWVDLGFGGLGLLGVLLSKGIDSHHDATVKAALAPNQALTQSLVQSITSGKWKDQPATLPTPAGARTVWEPSPGPMPMAPPNAPPPPSAPPPNAPPAP